MLLVCDGHGPAGAEASEGIVTTFLGRVAQDPVLHDCRASGKDAIAKQLEVIQMPCALCNSQTARSDQMPCALCVCGRTVLLDHTCDSRNSQRTENGENDTP